MEATPRPPQRWPGSDIVFEARRRAEVYAADWRDGFSARARILAPSTYIFLASLLPALAFGLQLDSDTEGVLGVVQVLAATAISGVVQAVVGGQPLLIVGVAEPVVLIYGFMYHWAAGRAGLGAGRFLAWAAWVCVWTAAMVLLLAASGACRWVGSFTRFSGELFGGLIGLLFLQQAVKGLIAQFRLDPNTSHSGDAEADAYVWRLVNGLWSLLLAGGLLLSALVVVRARSWRFLSKPLRGLLADYGAPACVLLWTGISFAVSPQADGAAPPGVPRRVSCGDVWGGSSTDGSGSSSGWRVAARMGEVPGPYIAAALLPAFVIAVLFYFDHSVSSLMAQQPEYGLARPPAFAYDLALLAALTAGCGLLGLPPVNGVLPQAPMHTRSLATLGSRAKGPTARHQRQRPRSSADGQSALEGAEIERRHSSGADFGAAPFVNGNANGSSTAAASAATAAMHFPTAAVELAAAPVGLRPRRHTPAAVLNASATAAAGSGAPAGGGDAAVAGGGAAGISSSHRPGVSAVGPPAATASLRPQSRSGGPGVSGEAAPGVGSAGREDDAGGSNCNGDGDGDGRQSADAAARRRLLSGRSSTEDAAAGREAVAHGCGAAAGRGGGGGDGGAVPVEPQQQPSETAGPRLGGSSPLQQGARGLEEAPLCRGAALPLCVLEQRLSGLLQSLGVAACLFATPAIRQIPQAALWGYFAFMAIESFQGSQLVDRVLLLITDPARRPGLAAAGPHAPYLETVPFAVTAAFTGLQVALLAGVWALVTWAGVAGVAFPLPIMALVPLRAFVLPRLFRPEHLRELDAAEYEQVPPAPPPEPPPELLPELLPPLPLADLAPPLAGPAAPGPSQLGEAATGLREGREGAAAPGAVVLAARGEPAAAARLSGGRPEPLVAVVVGGGDEQQQQDAVAPATAATAATASAAAAAVPLDWDWEAQRGLIEAEHVGGQPLHHVTRSQLRQRMAAAAAGAAAASAAAGTTVGPGAAAAAAGALGGAAGQHGGG
ncbi:hypothetical protein HXX76_008545 [Chlamydomonas incerta]|uniref:Bicarbonate transporter-like transmembrane domain-containing protein n=1 Tax=Chlamydomonas incerta TaxID=51695 RepID=A0A835SVY9_CHLIN|nr:hypothetical protein HXX76_008545 [Chlamydomonas incerta]|eukprot:KAG2432811.1 hypothetical protein HXX76_008545 [Chlamydomonas incerta]